MNANELNVEICRQTRVFLEKYDIEPNALLIHPVDWEELIRNSQMLYINLKGRDPSRKYSMYRGLAVFSCPTNDTRVILTTLE